MSDIVSQQDIETAVRNAVGGIALGVRKARTDLDQHAEAEAGHGLAFDSDLGVCSDAGIQVHVTTSRDANGKVLVDVSANFVVRNYLYNEEDENGDMAVTPIGDDADSHTNVSVAGDGAEDDGNPTGEHT